MGGRGHIVEATLPAGEGLTSRGLSGGDAAVVHGGRPNGNRHREQNRVDDPTDRRTHRPGPFVHIAKGRPELDQDHERQVLSADVAAKKRRARPQARKGAADPVSRQRVLVDLGHLHPSRIAGRLSLEAVDPIVELM